MLTSLYQGVRMFNGPDGLQYRWRPSSSTSDILVSLMKFLYNVLIRSFAVARCQWRGHCVFPSHPANSVPAWRRFWRAPLCPHGWCGYSGTHIPPCHENDHSNYYYFVSIDASPDNGHSHSYRDVVPILCPVEPLNESRDMDLAFALYYNLASMYYYVYNMSDL